MSIFQPFTPIGSTVLACTGTAASVTLPTGNGNQLLLQNDGTSAAWFTTGAVTATASAATGASTPILGGAIMIFTIPPDATVLSGITTATGTTTTLRVTKGVGP